MCRSIRVLRGADPPPLPGDVEAAARQYVRKVSGRRSPSRVNEAAFERAVRDVAAATERLLDAWEPRGAADAAAGRPKRGKGSGAFPTRE